jgi:hypothetical protein
MKYMRIGYTNQFRIPAPSYVYGRARNADRVMARMVTGAVLVAVAIAILALYLAMFVGLYRWGHYAPLFPPDGATVARTISQRAAFVFKV